MKQTVTLIRGLPGSGKSTLARRILAETNGDAVWVEADHYFIGADGKYRFNADKLRWAHSQCLDKASRALEQGQNLIVSNTFTTLRELRPYFDLSFSFGVIPEVRLCSGEYGSIHNVPDDAVERMRARFCKDVSVLYERQLVAELV
jgi:predicted kinase